MFKCVLKPILSVAVILGAAIVGTPVLANQTADSDSGVGCRRVAAVTPDATPSRPGSGAVASIAGAGSAAPCSLTNSHNALLARSIATDTASPLHFNVSRALTAQQMDQVWQREIDRIFNIMHTN